VALRRTSLVRRVPCAGSDCAAGATIFVLPEPAHLLRRSATGDSALRHMVMRLAASRVTTATMRHPFSAPELGTAIRCDCWRGLSRPPHSPSRKFADDFRRQARSSGRTHERFAARPSPQGCRAARRARNARTPRLSPRFPPLVRRKPGVWPSVARNTRT